MLVKMSLIYNMEACTLKPGYAIFCKKAIQMIYARENELNI